MNNKEVLTAKEAANYMGISLSTLYKLTSAKKITYYVGKGGKLLYFALQDIIGFMAYCRVASDSEIEQTANQMLRKGVGR